MYPDSTWAWILTGVLGYLLGGLSGALLTSGLFRKDDVRKYGSGNAGTTNVFRTYGPGLAAITLAFDMAKTIGAVLLGKYLLGEVGLFVAGGAALIGHAFPVYYRFRGGKSFLCAATLAILYDWRMACGLAVVFIALLLITRMMAVASVVSIALYSLCVWLMRHPPQWHSVFWAAVALLVLVLHRENVKRILRGTEVRLTKSSLHERVKEKDQ